MPDRRKASVGLFDIALPPRGGDPKRHDSLTARPALPADGKA
jgi:hypothetical protein